MRFQLVGFFCVTIFAFILLCLKTKNKENYWYGGFVFSIGLGMLAFNIDPNPAGIYQDEIVAYELLARFLSALSYRFSPYFLLLAGIAVSGVALGRSWWLKWVLASPVIIGFLDDLIRPAQGFIHIYLDYSPKFFLLAVWGFSYAFIANCMIVYSIWKETDSRAKFQKTLMAIMTLPSIYVTHQAYLEPITGTHGFSHITAGFGTFALLVFIFFAFRYGILGLKITIEKDARDSLFKAVNTGSAMLNHAIRNKVQLIDMVAVNLKQEIQTERAEQLISMIEYSSRHLMELITRIQRKTQCLSLVKEPNRIDELLDKAVEMVAAKDGTDRVKFEKNYTYKELVWCDAIHITEVFENLLTNAVEAIEGSGRVGISFYKRNKYVIIEIKDNGNGIDRDDLKRVVEPFYSTKPFGNGNFGLGLSYCYNVIKEHQGKLKIDSGLGLGTTVTIMLPL